ncbi:MAG TPA: ferrous iron transport protein B [Gemmataceae bacterium]|nr:ferrous iron transport protein B [Gemmataceae bacterium]
MEHREAKAVLPSPRHPVTPSPRQAIRVALLGNPNTGKTTLFNALAGMRQRVGNYPGVTVETKKGQFTFHGEVFELVDLPGTYSLAPRSPDEMLTVDLVLGQQAGEPRPDVLVAIVDASNLERNLYLTTQALELGRPVVVALNMIDVAQRQGIQINSERLARQLGVRVVPIQANKGRGLDRLREAIAAAATEDGPTGMPAFPSAFDEEVKTLHNALGNGTAPFLVRRLLLDIGGYTEERLASRHGTDVRAHVQAARQRLASAGCPVPAVEAKARYTWIRQAVAGCVERPGRRPVSWTDRIDRVLTHKLWGTLVFVALMFLVFTSIFYLAQWPMNWIKAGQDWLAARLGELLAAGPLSSLLIDGVVKGVGAVIVFLPQIAILFAFIAVLEDCGYMARAAFLMDKLMARCGLSGKSFIPMLSSVACAVPGIMATRVIENRRDRLATILVAPLMSCSARLPVYTLLIGAFLPGSIYGWWAPGVAMFALYFIGIIVAPLVALALKRTLLRGETPVFVMEMPLYKTPSLSTVFRRMTDSAWAFLRRAGTLILASMIVVWALLYFPSRGADGVPYEERIAQLNELVAQERRQFKELQESIAQQSEELAKLNEQASEAGIEHLPAPLEARRQELHAEVEPVQEQIKRLQEKLQPVDDQINRLKGEWKGQSILGRLGHAIEPAVEPLGWDWRIGTAALASFPAREVVVGTLGIIYNLGEVDTEEVKKAKDVGETGLAKALKEAEWDAGSRRAGQKVYSLPVALSLMVFFALCCQCASTLAVIRRETRSWRWPAFTFIYMTVLAYIGAFVVYQLSSWLSA